MNDAYDTLTLPDAELTPMPSAVAQCIVRNMNVGGHVHARSAHVRSLRYAASKLGMTIAETTVVHQGFIMKKVTRIA